jgi:hypothetical protein
VSYVVGDKTIKLDRPWLNGALLAPFGQMKSQIQKSVAAEFPSIFAQNVTYAAYVGSVSEEKNPTVPFAWQANGKVFLLNEFSIGKGERHRDFSRALLMLTNGEVYSRATSYEAHRPMDLKGESLSPPIPGTFYKVEGGVLTINTRSPYLFATTMPLTYFHRLGGNWALWSRLLPINYDLSQEDKRKASLRELEVQILHFRDKPEPVTVSAELTNKIENFYRERTQDWYGRTFDDLIRATAVLGYFDETVLSDIIALKEPKMIVRRRRI